MMMCVCLNCVCGVRASVDVLTLMFMCNMLCGGGDGCVHNDGGAIDVYVHVMCG